MPHRPTKGLTLRDGRVHDAHDKGRHEHVRAGHDRGPSSVRRARLIAGDPSKLRKARALWTHAKSPADSDGNAATACSRELVCAVLVEFRHPHDLPLGDVPVEADPRGDEHGENRPITFCMMASLHVPAPVRSAIPPPSAVRQIRAPMISMAPPRNTSPP